MIYERYIGAFIQNTLKPLIEELDKLLGKCEHLKLTRDDIGAWLQHILLVEVVKTVIWGVVYVCGFFLFSTFLFSLLTSSPTPTP